ncbi:Alpha/Beta hydrolase protein [Chlamydoabsidia padenii]|nr:Alpha/Beta hydrolase protein [Chlamydoabsidia padenii]
MVIIPSLLTLLLLVPYGVSAISAPWTNSTTPFIIHSINQQQPYYHVDDNTYSWWGHLARIWIAMECIFYLYYVIAYNRLQAIRKPKQSLTLDQRKQLYWKCLNAIEDVKAWSIGWFYYEHDMSHPTFEDIHRENLALWFCWAFWHDNLAYVLSNEDWAQELEWMIKTAEDEFQIEFTPGFNPDLQCIRLNLDPVLAVHRPLLLYLGLYLSTATFNMLALQWCWRFQVYGDHGAVWGGALYNLHRVFVWCNTYLFGRHSMKSTKSIPSTPTTDRHDMKRIVYWHRSVEDTRGETTAKTPLVFIHGIGAGLMCYVEFIYRLVGLDRPLFLVELPFVAMRMVDDVPDALTIVEDIKGMLQDHGYEHAIFVSHSLGTAVTSWMLTNAPLVVAGTVLIDPICFLLHYPQVCFNFIHRVPSRIIEFVMLYIASRELYISHYLSRHFQWFQCIYFADPTEPKDVVDQPSPLNNSIVFLSGEDRIVGSPMVSKYLTKCGVDNRMMPGLEHAGFLFDWSWRKQILEQIDWVARNVDDEGIDLGS